MDRSIRYSYEELIALLGDPIFENHVTKPGMFGATGVLAFACTCSGVQIGDGYHVVIRCEQHGGPEPIVKISTRRCGLTALGGLDMEATGVLAMLIGLQVDAERDDAGCVELAFDASTVADYPDGVRQLLGAGVLRKDLDDRLRLCYFTCFDAKAGEWY